MIQTTTLVSKPILISNEVLQEFCKASLTFPAFNSAHEGFAVLLEEIDELWEEVREKDRNPANMRKEAIQVAAMALRFIYDVCDKEKDN